MRALRYCGFYFLRSDSSTNVDLNIIKTIKLFAWEKKLSDRLAKKRDEELSWILPVQLLNLSNEVVTYVVSMGQRRPTADVAQILRNYITARINLCCLRCCDEASVDP